MRKHQELVKNFKVHPHQYESHPLSLKRFCKTNTSTWACNYRFWFRQLSLRGWIDWQLYHMLKNCKSVSIFSRAAHKLKLCPTYHKMFQNLKWENLYLLGVPRWLMETFHITLLSQPIIFRCFFILGTGQNYCFWKHKKECKTEFWTYVLHLHVILVE